MKLSENTIDTVFTILSAYCLEKGTSADSRIQDALSMIETEFAIQLNLQKISALDGVINEKKEWGALDNYLIK
jgi:hypothetical protein